MPLDRLLVVLLVIALVVLAGFIVRWWTRRTAAAVRAHLAPLPHPYHRDNRSGHAVELQQPPTAVPAIASKNRWWNRSAPSLPTRWRS